MESSQLIRIWGVCLVGSWLCGCQVPHTASPPGFARVVTPVAYPTPEKIPPRKTETQQTSVEATPQPPRHVVSPPPPVMKSLAAIRGLSPRDVFRNDRRDFLPMLARDTRGLMTGRNAAILGTALAASVVIYQDLDGEVRDYVDEHPERWGEASHVLGTLGEVQYQVPVLLGVYGYSLMKQDEELHSLSKSIISAYTITGLSTLSVKVIADTDRPSDEWNGGRFGFPSYHVGSSVAIAAVVEEYHGMKAALPIYALSGLIGWSRIDEQDHDLSDVVFGAALGYVIGKSVGQQHRSREQSFQFRPYTHPLGGAGLAGEIRF